MNIYILHVLLTKPVPSKSPMISTTVCMGYDQQWEYHCSHVGHRVRVVERDSRIYNELGLRDDCSDIPSLVIYHVPCVTNHGALRGNGFGLSDDGGGVTISYTVVVVVVVCCGLSLQCYLI